MNKLTAVLCFVLLPCLSLAAENHHPENDHGNKQESNIKVGVALTPGLRNLLSREMQSIQKGMQSIIPAYVSGNWGEVSRIAGKIKNSYILEQKLTDSQKKELHTLLPASFIKKDQQFHYLAGMLQHAAEMRKVELINFYFSQMNESCVSCHITFARHKFPALAPEQKVSHEH